MPDLEQRVGRRLSIAPEEGYDRDEFHDRIYDTLKLERKAESFKESHGLDSKLKWDIIKLAAKYRPRTTENLIDEPWVQEWLDKPWKALDWAYQELETTIGGVGAKYDTAKYVKKNLDKILELIPTDELYKFVQEKLPLRGSETDEELNKIKNAIERERERKRLDKGGGDPRAVAQEKVMELMSIYQEKNPEDAKYTMLHHDMGLMYTIALQEIERDATLPFLDGEGKKDRRKLLNFIYKTYDAFEDFSNELDDEQREKYFDENKKLYWVAAEAAYPFADEEYQKAYYARKAEIEEEARKLGVEIP